jgi:flavin reductase (DIM6/NTAB) family NADH-FMN oxidoreductase RutF
VKFHDNLDVMMEHLTKNGAFLTVKDSNGNVNTMTISWGFSGVVWSKPHFIALVRPQRFTREILKTADSFTISVPFGSLKKELGICGTESGKDIDKSKVVTFLDAKSVASPVVAGCNFYYECKINYVDSLHGEKIPQSINKMHYNQDWHDFFIGEIVETYGDLT